MITEEQARKQLKTLHQEGSALAQEFGAGQLRQGKLRGKRTSNKTINVVIRKFSMGEDKAEEQVPEPPPPPIEESHFEDYYQCWYSRALPLMKQLALDRYAEFQSFYVVDPRYPWGDSTAYVIQDYFRGRESDDAGADTIRCFKNQLAILKSVADRLAWSSLDTEDQVQRGLQLALLETARKLMDIDARAAGALAATVLETFLKKLTARHRLKFRRQIPPLREYIDALHTAKVLDIPIHAQATWLAEISDRSRVAGETPTKLQVRDLIDGTYWQITNVF
ncbi:MAG TPA: hypothetical protein VGH91_13450 [Gammaproteobacteria bacterium]